MESSKYQGNYWESAKSDYTANMEEAPLPPEKQQNSVFRGDNAVGHHRFLFGEELDAQHAECDGLGIDQWHNLVSSDGS